MPVGGWNMKNSFYQRVDKGLPPWKIWKASQIFHGSTHSTHKSALHVVITSNLYLLFQLSGEWSKLCGCSVCKLNVEFPVCHAKRYLIISGSWGWNTKSKSATHFIISPSGGLNVSLSSSVSLNNKDGVSEPAALAWHLCENRVKPLSSTRPLVAQWFEHLPGVTEFASSIPT